jgi:hypothetical protein
MTESDELVADAHPGDGRNSETRDRPAPQRPLESAVAHNLDASSATQVPAVEIHATKIVKVLGCCIIALVVLHGLAMVSWFQFGHVYLKGFVPLFNLEGEKNVPTLFASLQLILAAVLLGICAAQQKLAQGKFFKHWVGLSAIFVFLAFDESALIHEKSFRITQELFGTSGLLYYSWIIPFGLFALVVFLTYIRFLFALPRRTGVIFFLSGAVFVTGAIGMEMFEGQINEAGGYRSFDYMVLVTIEEILEMVGILAFIYGILDYMTSEGRRANVSLVK